MKDRGTRARALYEPSKLVQPCNVRISLKNVFIDFPTLNSCATETAKRTWFQIQLLEAAIGTIMHEKDDKVVVLVVIIVIGVAADHQW